MANQNTPAAEVEIDAGLVRILLTEQHPDLAQLELTHLTSGWDNALFRLGADLVVRLPRRHMAGKQACSSGDPSAASARSQAPVGLGRRSTNNSFQSEIPQPLVRSTVVSTAWSSIRPAIITTSGPPYCAEQI